MTRIGLSYRRCSLGGRVARENRHSVRSFQRGWIDSQLQGKRAVECQEPRGRGGSL